MFVFKSAIPLISFKPLVFKENNVAIFLICEKFNFPFVLRKLFTFVSFFLRFTLIILSVKSRL